MNEAKRLLKECKQILAEIRCLISAIQSMSPEEVLKKIKDLPLKEKAVLLRIIRRGEMIQQMRSVREKNPTYIF